MRIGCPLFIFANTRQVPRPFVRKDGLDMWRMEKVLDKWRIYNGGSVICPVALARVLCLLYDQDLKYFLVGLKSRPKVVSWPFISIGSMISSHTYPNQFLDRTVFS